MTAKSPPHQLSGVDLEHVVVGLTMTSTLTDIADLDGSEAVRRRLNPSSTSTLVVEDPRRAARGRSTCKVSEGGKDGVPRGCRQAPRLAVNDQVWVDDREGSRRHRRGLLAHHARSPGRREPSRRCGPRRGARR